MVQCHQIKAQLTAVLCRQFSRKREASKWGWKLATVSSIMDISLLERNIMSLSFLSFNLQAERINAATSAYYRSENEPEAQEVFGNPIKWLSRMTRIPDPSSVSCVRAFSSRHKYTQCTLGLKVYWKFAFQFSSTSTDKSLIESWGTTFLSDWQPSLIFVWFTSKSCEL